MSRGQTGIALITALIVVAIATLAATALLSSASVSIHRTASLRDSEQAWWVARGVEAWVLGILQKDAEDNDYDGLDEPWALPVDYLPVDDGYVRGFIVDQQGRFNLNNLAKPNAPEYAQQLERLIAGIPDLEQPPSGLVAAIKDWIDADDSPGFPGGAEDTAYLNLAPPYRAANREFTVVSELLAIQGVTPQIYRGLRDLVTALPETTPVNVNTAPEPVLRALSAQVDEMKLRQFVERRKEQPIKDAQGMEELKTQGIFGPDVKSQHLAYASRYFQIQGEVFIGSGRVALYSLMRRPDPGTPTVLAHSADAD